MSKYFDNVSRSVDDECAINARDYQNVSMNEYNLWNTYKMKCDPESQKKLEDFSINNPNLHYRNGYGFTTACYVDNDTELRVNGKITNEKAKTQLFHRFYQGPANLSKGLVVPHLESRLTQGEDTSQLRECHKVSEQDFNRFVPMLPCVEEVQKVKHVVPEWTRGGDNSRILMIDSQSAKKCGFGKHRQQEK